MNYNNLAQKTNFTAGSDKLGISTLFLNSVNLPGISLSHPELGSRSGSKLNLTGDTLSYNSLSIEVLVDEDFLVYHELMGKIFTNVDQTTGVFTNNEFDFWVDITNSKGNHLFKVEFNSCRFESIGDITFETSSDETEFVLSAEIKYDYYNIVKSTTIPTLRT